MSAKMEAIFPRPQCQLARMVREMLWFDISQFSLIRPSSPPLRWRHNGRDNVSNHQPHDCLLNRLFRRRSKKTSKLRVTGLCKGNSPGTGEFPAQMTSNAENVSIWWRLHVTGLGQSYNSHRPNMQPLLTILQNVWWFVQNHQTYCLIIWKPFC